MGRSLEQWKAIIGEQYHDQLTQKACNRPSIPASQHECNIVNESLEAKKVARFDSKVAIKIHSVRHRLLDIDNLFSKYLVDGLRYCGVLKDDSAEFVSKIEHTQEKGKLEYTRLIIEEL